MVELKVTKIGDSLGIVLPADVINRLHTGDGQALYLVEAADGSYVITPCDPTLEEKMAKVDDICSRYHTTLHVLAQ